MLSFLRQSVPSELLKSSLSPETVQPNKGPAERSRVLLVQQTATSLLSQRPPLPLSTFSLISRPWKLSPEARLPHLFILLHLNFPADDIAHQSNPDLSIFTIHWIHLQSLLNADVFAVTQHLNHWSVVRGGQQRPERLQNNVNKTHFCLQQQKSTWLIVSPRRRNGNLRAIVWVWQFNGVYN